MKRWIQAFGLVGLLVVAASPSRADVIYDNGTPDLLNAYASDFAGSGFQSSDDFVLASGASTIADVHWWGAYGFDNTAPALDNFTIRIYSDAGGIPAATPFYEEVVGDAVNRTSTGDNVAGFDVYSYDTDITPVTLTAGTSYWLSIVNNTDGNSSNWFWTTSDALAGNAVQRTGEDGEWFNQGVELAFNLTAVPEPASMVSLGLGLAGMALVRRRLKKAD